MSKPVDLNELLDNPDFELYCQMYWDAMLKAGMIEASDSKADLDEEYGILHFKEFGSFKRVDVSKVAEMIEKLTPPDKH